MITIYKVSVFEQCCPSAVKTEYFLDVENADSFINSISGSCEEETITVWELNEFTPEKSNIKRALFTLTDKERRELKKNINKFI